MAKGRPWIRWTRRTLYVLIALILLGFVAEEINRGIVMRPVRSLAEKVGIKISPPALSDDERKEARQVISEWRDACLRAYPALTVKARQVPLDENGFWQLFLLEESLELSEELRDLLPRISEGYNADAAKRLLNEHGEELELIERIAAMKERSSLGLPDQYMGFIGLRTIKQSHDLLLLKACVAADEKDADRAFHYIQLSGAIADHLRHIETPFLLSETGAILFEQARQWVVLEQILPKLGDQTDLKKWLHELNSLNMSGNQRLAELWRGEWQIASTHIAFPLIADMDYSGELADGKACVMAYSEWIDKQIKSLQAAGPYEIPEEGYSEDSFDHLSAEQHDIISVLAIGTKLWAEGFHRSAVVTARSVAAIELLILEQEGEELSADSIQKVTKDPVTGKPFIFNPASRELEVGDDGLYEIVEPIKLPW